MLVGHVLNIKTRLSIILPVSGFNVMKYGIFVIAKKRMCPKNIKGNLDMVMFIHRLQCVPIQK